jgi:Flp pilus assembly protein CpaB
MHTRSVALARLRLRFSRSAVAYWIAVGVLVMLTVAVLDGVLHRARASQAALGPSTSVVVATTDLAPGSLLDGHVAIRSRPARLVPHGALTALPSGRVATAFIANGEPVLPARVSGTDAAGAAGLVSPADRALTVPVGSVALPVRVGDRVDVLATPVPGSEPTGSSVDGGAGTDRSGGADGSGNPTARVVVRNALVVATGTDGVTVAVPAEQAPALAAAIARATVTLALTGPPADASTPG